jgi:signal transduction histidine kinase
MATSKRTGSALQVVHQSLAQAPLAQGSEHFTIASRIVREFGERLVKQPEVALLELIKNSYDADATECIVDYAFPDKIVVSDNGHGMTLEEFLKGWMRIGTSVKNLSSTSRTFERRVSGEKGIGRFAVSYLGRHLKLKSIAYDKTRKCLTELTATFDWPQFDQAEDLGTVSVPYKLIRAPMGATTGTVLEATALRPSTEHIDFREVQTSSMGLLSPYQSLLRNAPEEEQSDLPPLPTHDPINDDPGFTLKITGASDEGPADISAKILRNFVFRCVVGVEGNRLKLRLYRRGERKPILRINDRYKGEQGRIYADLRFFPFRKGTFSGMPVDGREARTWIKNNSGVAVFDRDFRVLPYGTEGDDWLSLAADNARNVRNPTSSIAQRHFPMSDEVRQSTQLNYMLRLPYPYQLVGAVQVYGVRTTEQSPEDIGLVATADRQGFVDNRAYRDLVDIIRGAAEVIAYADRELQLETLARESEELAESAERETEEAIAQIRANPSLSSSDKSSLIKRLSTAQRISAKAEDLGKSRDEALEVMSLLGVVAGFMTHEFGTAIYQLEQALLILRKHARGNPAIAEEASTLEKHIAELKEFVKYSQGYIHGASAIPDKPYPARPRIQSVIRVFGKYASTRGIDVEIDADSSVMAPRVPVSLYGGLILNLYTNALKAVMARPTDGENVIAIRAWTDQKFHRLQVSDTGVGIPPALEERVFDPLFSTTESSKDPLGSGMGLGLSLVRRGAKAFGGQVNIVKPPPGFVTCFEVKFPNRDYE